MGSPKPGASFAAEEDRYVHTEPELQDPSLYIHDGRTPRYLLLPGHTPGSNKSADFEIPYFIRQSRRSCNQSDWYATDYRIYMDGLDEQIYAVFSDWSAQLLRAQ